MTGTAWLAPLVLAAGVAAAELPGPLTAQTGDPASGRDLFVSRDGGHCILCHRVDGLDAPFQGTVGPPLTGIATRRGAAEIRARIMDPTRFNGDAAMPAYYRRDGLQQVPDALRGRTVLTAQQIEDLVAYLMTLEAR
jgi:sulfur-oxidizing protein SoxX